MSPEAVHSELLNAGVYKEDGQTSELDARLMLTEVRLLSSGRMPGGKASRPKPASYSCNYEKYMWECDAYRAMYDRYDRLADSNAINLMMEYANNPEEARPVYEGGYAALMKEVDEALATPNKPKEKRRVKSPKLRFNGFPANMGEQGCRMTLEALGNLASFECAVSEDELTLSGVAEYEDTETAQKAVDQYDGFDMGGGSNLRIYPA
jgi:hypothetical protein